MQSTEKRRTLAILDMFDPGVVHLISGADIDAPHNELCLIPLTRRLFGDMRIYFEGCDDDDAATPHTYDVKATKPSFVMRALGLPWRRTLYGAPDGSVLMPEARLLRIHATCCKMAHLTGAGAYIEKILRDGADNDDEMRANGSFPLGELVSLRAWQVGA